MINLYQLYMSSKQFIEECDTAFSCYCEARECNNCKYDKCDCLSDEVMIDFFKYRI